ncbi:MAG: molybdate ABC transporter substrate-binding protein [Chthonomonadales bacterium]
MNRTEDPPDGYRRFAGYPTRATPGLLSLALAVLLFACGSPGMPAPARTSLTVAAAADLARALPRIGAAFQKRTGIGITVVLGSTGLLERQIENGAPFDVFMAADDAHVSDAARSGRVLPGSERTYALGILAIWTRPGGAPMHSIKDLARPSVSRIAIANPLHAPYGKAAVQALRRAGLWGVTAPKLVYGENVQQALRYAQSGAADAALIAYPLVIGGPGSAVPIPMNLYRPPRQTLCVLKASRHGPEAMRFAAFVCGPEGRAILKRFGYVLPQSLGKE